MKITTSINKLPLDHTTNNKMHPVYRILIEGYGSEDECILMADNIHKALEVDVKPTHKGSWGELATAIKGLK